MTSRRAASREGFTARLAEGPFGALRGHVDSGRLGGSGPRSGPLLWHRGLATTDLAVADRLLRRAADTGLGTLLRYR